MDKRYEGEDTIITIDEDKCDGNATCVDVCPAEVYIIENEKANPINIDDCLFCMVCVNECPNEAITVEEK